MSCNRGSKKLINDVPNCVRDSLKGYVSVHSGLQLVEDSTIVVRGDLNYFKKSGKVTIVTGGGAGHEPGHAGYVGPGMLTAAVHGAIFASPPSSAILTAIHLVAEENPAGTLVLVSNYTGDRLNFGLAVEQAQEEGLKVRMVVIGEDCALSGQDKNAGRRGLCGVVLIFKIAGAMAEEGKSLEEIQTYIESVIRNMGTIGISLTSCSVPGSGPSFQIGPDEVELGLGIHGEAGVARLKMSSAQDIVILMINHMTKEDSSSNIAIRKNDHLAIVVNNLGGTSQLELNIVAKEVINYLENSEVYVDRAYCGTFLTSLEMAGVSVTLLHLNTDIIKYLDASTSAPAWMCPFLTNKSAIRETPFDMKLPDIIPKNKDMEKKRAKISKASQQLFEIILKALCMKLINSENMLNQLDQEAGDGDCGSTLRRGAEEILRRINSGTVPLDYPKSTLLSLAAAAEESMGGCSGALYSLFLTGAAKAFISECTTAAWCNAINLGLKSVIRYGGAIPGDRTMVDPLHAACMSLNKDILPEKKYDTQDMLSALHDAAKAAEVATDATTKMKAKAGRASYVSEDRLTGPDPGSQAVSLLLRQTYTSMMEYFK